MTQSPAAAADLGPAFAFDNSYARLPERFFVRQPPAPAPAPRLLRVNAALAEDLGLDPAALASPAGAEVLAGARTPEGSEPLAMAYAGHQFGGWSPQLGDGRALLLGEVHGRDGRRWDVQLKGSGRTPFSRSGDGKAALGPVLREYIVSEAMHALGVPTTRALAAALTGETVLRERPLPGAVLTRVSRGHVRVGTFQFFFAREDVEALRALTDYCLARLHPEVEPGDKPAESLLNAVIAAQADLVAQWLSLGFVHGVMNTDNMSIAGETIDYGPCAFMEAYHPKTVFSSIDQFGRYAYENQGTIAQWNLARLAQALLPLLGETQEAAVELAQAAVDRFPILHGARRLARFAPKLGIARPGEGDLALIDGFLEALQAGEADFTSAFRQLAALPDAVDLEAEAALGEGFADTAALDAWLPRWRARLAAQGLAEAARQAMQRAANPAFIPRNHRVEEA
ncbi:MAG: YdiU family protein, partial [Pseudomonadota bacterium]